MHPNPPPKKTERKPGPMFRAAMIIYRKELTETFRDRRTLVAMFLIPMILYPASLMLTSETLLVEQREQKSATLSVSVSPGLPRTIRKRLSQRDGINVRRLDAQDDPLAVLRASPGSIVLTSASTATEALLGQGTAEIELLFNPTDPWIDQVVERVESHLQDIAVAILHDRLERIGLPDSLASPISVQRRSVATRDEIGNHLLATAIPSLVLLFIALSSFYPAVDLTAGEKERKTLATLITAPVSPRAIVWGKYLAVVTAGTTAGLANVVALTLTLLRAFSSAQGETGFAFQVGPWTWPGLLLGVFLLALPTSALMLITASLSRSFRDASHLLTPVFLICLFPAVLAALPSQTLNSSIAFLPLANAALLIKSFLTVPNTWTHAWAQILAVFASTMLFTLVLLRIAERIFDDERALFSTEGRRAEFRQILSAPNPGLSLALGFVAMVFVINYYAGILTERLGAGWGILASQLVAHGLPTLCIAVWLRSSIAPQTLLLVRWPASWKISASAALVGTCAWLGVSLPAAWLSATLWPEQAKALEWFQAFVRFDEMPLWMAFLSLSLVPAIVEELVFRGVVLSLLRRTLSNNSAVWMQALLFGLMHGSVFRFLPTSALGWVLGYLAARSGSIVPSILVHAMTNAILLGLERSGQNPLTSLKNPNVWALVATGVVAVVLYRLRAKRP
jgi:sodium transport system permease protein